MTYDPNLPPQLSEDYSFNNEEVRTKPCEECGGDGYTEWWNDSDDICESDCEYCGGTGVEPMTQDDIREEIENKKEKQSGLYNQ